MDESYSADKAALIGGCTFNQRLKSKPIVYESFGFKESVWDIEELVSTLKRKKVSIEFFFR
jgi:hypothetical protein